VTDPNPLNVPPSLKEAKFVGALPASHRPWRILRAGDLIILMHPDFRPRVLEGDVLTVLEASPPNPFPNGHLNSPDAPRGA
jgi:hypothetical protein